MYTLGYSQGQQSARGSGYSPVSGGKGQSSPGSGYGEGGLTNGHHAMPGGPTAYGVASGSSASYGTGSSYGSSYKPRGLYGPSSSGAGGGAVGDSGGLRNKVALPSSDYSSGMGQYSSSSAYSSSPIRGGQQSAGRGDENELSSSPRGNRGNAVSYSLYGSVGESATGQTSYDNAYQTGGKSGDAGSAGTSAGGHRQKSIYAAKRERSETIDLFSGRRGSKYAAVDPYGYSSAADPRARRGSLEYAAGASDDYYSRSPEDDYTPNINRRNSRGNRDYDFDTGAGSYRERSHSREPSVSAGGVTDFEFLRKYMTEPPNKSARSYAVRIPDKLAGTSGNPDLDPRMLNVISRDLNKIATGSDEETFKRFPYLRALLRDESPDSSSEERSVEQILRRNSLTTAMEFKYGSKSKEISPEPVIPEDEITEVDREITRGHDNLSVDFQYWISHCDISVESIVFKELIALKIEQECFAKIEIRNLVRESVGKASVCRPSKQYRSSSVKKQIYQPKPPPPLPVVTAQCHRNCIFRNNCAKSSNAELFIPSSHRIKVLKRYRIPKIPTVEISHNFFMRRRTGMASYCATQCSLHIMPHRTVQKAIVSSKSKPAVTTRQFILWQKPAAMRIAKKMFRKSKINYSVEKTISVKRVVPPKAVTKKHKFTRYKFVRTADVYEGFFFWRMPVVARAKTEFTIRLKYSDFFRITRTFCFASEVIAKYTAFNKLSQCPLWPPPPRTSRPPHPIQATKSQPLPIREVKMLPGDEIFEPISHKKHWRYQLGQQIGDRPSPGFRLELAESRVINGSIPCPIYIIGRSPSVLPVFMIPIEATLSKKSPSPEPHIIQRRRPSPRPRPKPYIPGAVTSDMEPPEFTKVILRRLSFSGVQGRVRRRSRCQTEEEKGGGASGHHSSSDEESDRAPHFGVQLRRVDARSEGRVVKMDCCVRTSSRVKQRGPVEKFVPRWRRNSQTNEKEL